MDEEGLRYDPVYSTICSLKTPTGIGVNAYMFVSDREDFNGLFTVITPQQEKTTVGDGVWISSAFASEYGTKPEDEYQVSTVSGKTFPVHFDNAFLFYLMRGQILMTSDTYEARFGETAVKNSVLVQTNRGDLAGLQEKLSSIEGYLCINDYYSSNIEAFNSLSGILTGVSYMYLVLAAVMAMLVTLNLQIMCAEEKKRQLLTLRINGFSLRKVYRYFYCDTIALSVFGELAGIVLGTLCAFLTLNATSSNMTSFVKRFSWSSALMGILVCSALTVLTCLVAIRRIRKYKMTNINQP